MSSNSSTQCSVELRPSTFRDSSVFYSVGLPGNHVRIPHLFSCSRRDADFVGTRERQPVGILEREGGDYDALLAQMR